MSRDFASLLPDVIIRVSRCKNTVHAENARNDAASKLCLAIVLRTIEVTRQPDVTAVRSPRIYRLCLRARRYYPTQTNPDIAKTPLYVKQL